MHVSASGASAETNKVQGTESPPPLPNVPAAVVAAAAARVDMIITSSNKTEQCGRPTP